MRMDGFSVPEMNGFLYILKKFKLKLATRLNRNKRKEIKLCNNINIT